MAAVSGWTNRRACFLPPAPALRPSRRIPVKRTTACGAAMKSLNFFWGYGDEPSRTRLRPHSQDHTKNCRPVQGESCGKAPILSEPASLGFNVIGYFYCLHVRSLHKQTSKDDFKSKDIGMAEKSSQAQNFFWFVGPSATNRDDRLFRGTKRLWKRC